MNTKNKKFKTISCETLSEVSEELAKLDLNEISVIKDNRNDKFFIEKETGNIRNFEEVIYTGDPKAFKPKEESTEEAEPETIADSAVEILRTKFTYIAGDNLGKLDQEGIDKILKEIKTNTSLRKSLKKAGQFSKLFVAAFNDEFIKDWAMKLPKEEDSKMEAQAEARVNRKGQKPVKVVVLNSKNDEATKTVDKAITKKKVAATKPKAEKKAPAAKAKAEKKDEVKVDPKVQKIIDTIKTMESPEDDFNKWSKDVEKQNITFTHKATGRTGKITGFAVGTSEKYKGRPYLIIELEDGKKSMPFFNIVDRFFTVG